MFKHGKHNQFSVARFGKKEARKIKKAEKKAEKKVSKAEKAVEKVEERTVRSTIDDANKAAKEAKRAAKGAKQAASGISVIREELKDPKDIKDFGKKVIKFAKRPETAGIVGDIGVGAGEVIGVIGLATGQPELVGAGSLLVAGGQQLQSLADKQEKLQKKKESGKLAPGVIQIEAIETLFDVFGDKVDLGFGKDVAELADTVVNQVKAGLEPHKEDRELITQQQELLQTEGEEIKSAIKVIDELGDRLNEEVNPPSSLKSFLSQAKNVEPDQALPFVERNFKQIERLSDNERFELYSSLGLI